MTLQLVLYKALVNIENIEISIDAHLCAVYYQEVKNTITK